MHFSKDHLGTESDRNRTRALKSRLFLALSVVTRLVAPLRNLRSPQGSGYASDFAQECLVSDQTGYDARAIAARERNVSNSMRLR